MRQLHGFAQAFLPQITEGVKVPWECVPILLFMALPGAGNCSCPGGFLTATQNRGELVPSGAGINLRNHSLIYLFFFFHFTTTGHPTGLLESCKIPINHANILLLLSLSPCPFFLHSSTINRAKWIFFFLICREK